MGIAGEGSIVELAAVSGCDNVDGDEGTRDRLLEGDAMEVAEGSMGMGGGKRIVGGIDSEVG